jgi:hypothetical protein
LRRWKSIARFRTIRPSQWPKRGRVFEAVDLLPSTQKSVLHHVAGVGGVAQPGVGDRQRDAFETADQLRERLGVVHPRPGDEFFNAGLHAFALPEAGRHRFDGPAAPI